MECTNCPDAEKCGRKLELAIAGVTGWKCLHEFSLENVIEHLNTLMDRRVLSDEWTDMIGRAVELLKEQDERLRKLQKDKDNLCLEISEWKHKFHDAPPKFVSQGVVDQIRWERDTALSQLEQIGKGLGSKMDDIVALLDKQDSEKKRILKIVWDTLHEGLSIDTVSDQDWVYERIRNRIEGTYPEV